MTTLPLAILIVLVAFAIGAQWIAPFDPLETNWSAIRQAPNEIYWLGTDEIGRDVLSRVIWGARASLFAGSVAVVLAMGIGVPIGLISGVAGGVLDGVLMRATDAVLSIPPLISALTLAAIFGPSLTNAALAIGVAVAPAYVRLTRAQAMDVKGREFVEVARAIGNPEWRIALGHVLPNILPALLVQASMTAAFAIVTEASLSFLGLGQQPPDPSWGSMLTSARSFLDVAPWMAIWPGISIFCTVLALNLLGDALRDSLDPRRRT